MKNIYRHYMYKLKHHEDGMETNYVIHFNLPTTDIILYYMSSYWERKGHQTLLSTVSQGLPSAHQLSH